MSVRNNYEQKCCCCARWLYCLLHLQVRTALPTGHRLSTYGRSNDNTNNMIIWQYDQYKHCERSVSTRPTQCDCSHILALPGYANAPFTSRFKGLLFAWTLWIYLPNLKFVALRVPGIIGGTLKFRKSLDKPTLPFLPLPNLNFVALPIPEIIGGSEKNWAVPGYANAPFSPKFLKGFCWDKPCEYTCQIWSS